MPVAPNSATLFAFNVGFGDCFLLRFNYDKKRRHVLIDFGTMSRPPEPRPGNYMTKVAEQIKTLCGGKLDVVVATHRHRDHISGFSTEGNAIAPGDVIKSCKPKLVVQPWTEHPRAARDASVAPDKSGKSVAFARALKKMEDVATELRGLVDETKGAPHQRMLFNLRERKLLSFLGENNISNRSAVENLIEMGEDAKSRYVCFGENPGMGRHLPGVKVEVLGPPSLEQSEQIRKQRRRHDEEYWHLQAEASAVRSDDDILFPGAVNIDPPEWTHFGQKKLREIRKESLFSIVRQLDGAMNNTSLILLFTVGRKSILFPGDAQWENWSYALSRKNVCRKLETVDVYKVGHHGSLNATPKSLWKLFENRGPKNKRGRLLSVNSTKHGVHHHSEETAVPRKELVDELKRESKYHSTEDVEITGNSTTFYERIAIRFS